MFSNRLFKWAAFALFLMLVSLDSGLLIRAEAATCMGVQILSEEDRKLYTQRNMTNYSGMLEYNGASAPLDIKSSTLYLSQNIHERTRAKDLSGELAINSEEHTLYFAPDSNFSDLDGAAQSGHPFTLLVVAADNTYREYRVIFTMLPVLKLDGEVTQTNEEGEDVLTGDLCLWTPEDPETGRYSAKSSAVQWHLRGNTTKTTKKKSWKLSLQDEQGLNNDLDFLGLGKDDDWILNPLVLDDTKLKEKLFIDLWNDWADQNPWNYKMAAGEYVEVIRNDAYSGVYLLQRRIDRKYYRLTEDDILLKGQNTWVPNNLQEAYEILYSPLGDEETLKIMEGVFTGSDVSMIQLDNFLDMNLFLQFSAAIDNRGYKNTYYLLKWSEDAYQLIMIPWDTDMSLGVTFTTAFTYDYARSMNTQTLRREYSAMQREIPELKTLMSFRWEELRRTVFSEESVLKQLEENQKLLSESGALKRDRAIWPQMYKGQDTAENLVRFVQERLLRLDEYYAH